MRAVSRTRFEQVLALIPVFGPKTVVCHTGYDERIYWAMREVFFKRSMETWSWLAEQMRGSGVQLMLENVFDPHPDDMRVLLDKLKAQGVGFCLDTGHQSVFSRASLPDWVQALEPYLGQLHLHDNTGARDEHLGLGQGTIDFRNLFNMLKAVRRQPPIITLEPHREEALWPSLEYLEAIWPW